MRRAPLAGLLVGALGLAGCSDPAEPSPGRPPSGHRRGGRPARPGRRPGPHLAGDASEIPYVSDATTGQRISRLDSAALADRTLDGWPAAHEGSFLEFTSGGPQVVTTDPWEGRLDAVESGYDHRS